MLFSIIILTKWHGLTTPLPLLVGLKIVYSYVIEVANYEFDLGLHGEALVSEILAFYTLGNI